jgi:hypothetical protein
LLVALVNQQFAGNYIPDEYEEMYSANLVIDQIPFHIQLCDSPGRYQNQFSNDVGDHAYFEHGRRPCLAGVDVFFVCVSFISAASYTSAVEFWVPLIRKMSGDAPIVLIGCKDEIPNGEPYESVCIWQHKY